MRCAEHPRSSLWQLAAARSSWRGLLFVCVFVFARLHAWCGWVRVCMHACVLCFFLPACLPAMCILGHVGSRVGSSFFPATAVAVACYGASAAGALVQLPGCGDLDYAGLVVQPQYADCLPCLPGCLPGQLSMSSRGQGSGHAATACTPAVSGGVQACKAQRVTHRPPASRRLFEGSLRGWGCWCEQGAGGRLQQTRIPSPLPPSLCLCGVPRHHVTSTMSLSVPFSAKTAGRDGACALLPATTLFLAVPPP